VSSLQRSEGVFLLDGFLVGGVLGLSEGVDPGSGGDFLLLDGLLLVGGQQAALALEGLLSSLSAVFVGLSGGFLLDFGVGVEPVEELVVVEGVLLSVLDLVVGLLGSDGGLDLVGVDDSGDVGVGEGGSVQVEAVSGLAAVLVGAEDLVELSEGGLGPEHQSSELAAWGELQQAESVDVEDVDAWHVSEGSLHVGLVVTNDHQGASLLTESLVPELSLSGSDLLGGVHSEHIVEQAQLLEDGNGLLSLGNIAELVVHNQWQLGQAADLVTSSQNQRHDSGGGDGRSDGVSLLLDIDSSVPSSPHVQRSEHSSASALVAESSLTRSVGTRSRNSGNTSDGSSGSPRLGGVLVSSSGVDSVSLSSVLVQVGVNEVDDVQSNGGSEDCRGSNLGVGDFSGGRVVDGDQRTSGHFILLIFLLYLF